MFVYFIEPARNISIIRAITFIKDYLYEVTNYSQNMYVIMYHELLVGT